MRLIEFAGNDFLQAGSSYVSLKHPRLVIQALQCSKLFRSAKPGLGDSFFKYPNCFVIDFQGDWKRVPVLAAVGERETRRVRKTAG